RAAGHREPHGHGWITGDLNTAAGALDVAAGRRIWDERHAHLVGPGGRGREAHPPYSRHNQNPILADGPTESPRAHPIRCVEMNRYEHDVAGPLGGRRALKLHRATWQVGSAVARIARAATNVGQGLG